MRLVIVMTKQMLRFEPSTKKHCDPRVQVTVVEQGAPPEGPEAPKLSAITVLSPNISSVTALHAETIETRGCINQTSMPPSLGGKMPVWMSKKPRLQQQPA